MEREQSRCIWMVCKIVKEYAVMIGGTVKTWSTLGYQNGAEIVNINNGRLSEK